MGSSQSPLEAVNLNPLNEVVKGDLLVLVFKDGCLFDAKNHLSGNGPFRVVIPVEQVDNNRQSFLRFQMLQLRSMVPHGLKHLGAQGFHALEHGIVGVIEFLLCPRCLTERRYRPNFVKVSLNIEYSSVVGR